jgi:glyoxylase I family protein
MIRLNGVHHVAIICRDYGRSKKFYTEVLGLRIIAEHFRKERNSYKLDLALNDRYVIELFSFPDPPKRVSRPEAAGLRHLAFEVADLDQAIAHVNLLGVKTEPVRVDEYTGKRFTFFEDPDELPLEFYEA